MFWLPWPDANRREKDCHLGALAHILHAFHSGGRRDNQCTCIGIKVIEKYRQGHWNITNCCACKSKRSAVWLSAIRVSMATRWCCHFLSSLIGTNGVLPCPSRTRDRSPHQRSRCH